MGLAHPRIGPKPVPGETTNKSSSALATGGLLRRRRVRKLILAHLLRERMEGADEGMEEGFGGGEEHQLARFLIASGGLHRRRIRKMILAHLLRERGEGGEEMEGLGEEEEGRRGGGEAREAVH